MTALYCDGACQAADWADHRIFHDFLAIGPKTRHPAMRIHWFPNA